MKNSIDLTHAKKQFENYLSDYDIEDPKIHLKVTHTYRVMEVCRTLATALSFDEEGINLATLIGLLHDIGRFEQLRLTNSFDDSIIPHAKCSLDVLFTQGYIHKFVENPMYDDIIYESIKNHGLFQIDSSLEGDCLLYAKLIRDADKLDNFHTKLIEEIDTMLDVDMDNLAKETISDYAYETFLAHKPLENSKRKTHLDMWLSYIAYIYDLNFQASFCYTKEHDYANRLFARIPYKHPDTISKIKTLQNCMNSFILLKTENTKTD
ncbi:MAG: HD domain-containing protein [Lachnospiraceae bacterium]|nr:HD domain-containing protein [Lachnospiraceae bacterium]